MGKPPGTSIQSQGWSNIHPLLRMYSLELSGRRIHLFRFKLGEFNSKNRSRNALFK